MHLNSNICKICKIKYVNYESKSHETCFSERFKPICLIKKNMHLHKHPVSSNHADILKAGGLHNFLKDLHELYGAITGFWYGEQYVVSIASPELFKQHVKVFDRPVILFKHLEPLIGKHSIQYANGADGRERRKEYDRYFHHDSIKHFFSIFNEIGEELTKKWDTLPPSQHIPLHQYMMALALKTSLKTIFGSEMMDEKKILEFNSLYSIVMTELDGNTELFHTADSTQQSALQEALKKFHSLVSEVINNRMKVKTRDTNIFLDFLLEKGLSLDELISEVTTYIVGSFHTTGNLLTWMFYFVATHAEVEEKLYQEIISVNGTKQSIKFDNVNKLVYMTQVLKEAIRLSILAPYAARYHDIDVEIGGHIIPKGTPVIHALGVVLHDKTYWPLPEIFDPERFNAETSKSRPPLAFSPFGFAGQRICPGQKFTYSEAYVYVSMICRKFRITLVDDQVVTPIHGFVTHPEDEIWVTIEPRKSVE